MTASGQLVASGHRYAAAYALDPSTGLIAPPAVDTPYYGASIKGSQAFQANFPPPRKITHTGNDRVLAIDWLPPLEAMDATIQAGATDYDLIATLSGVLVETVGTARLIPILTDKQGYEPSVGLHLFQQALDFDLGIRRWQSYLFSSAKAIFMPSSQTEAANVVQYAIAPTVSKKTLWGVTLTELANGAKSAQMGKMMTIGKMLIVAWEAGGVAVDFLLDVAKPAVNATDAWLAVSKNGTVVTPASKTAAKITFAVAPTAGDIIIALYETSASE